MQSQSGKKDELKIGMPDTVPKTFDYSVLPNPPQTFEVEFYYFYYEDEKTEVQRCEISCVESHPDWKVVELFSLRCFPIRS